MAKVPGSGVDEAGAHDVIPRQYYSPDHDDRLTRIEIKLDALTSALASTAKDTATTLAVMNHRLDQHDKDIAALFGVHRECAKVREQDKVEESKVKNRLFLFEMAWKGIVAAAALIIMFKTLFAK